MTFPRTPDEGGGSNPSSAGVRPTIVLADDHRQMLDCVSDLLAGSYEILAQVQDGNTAYSTICALRPDLATLDINMPGMNGLQIARALRKAGVSTRLIFLTIAIDEDYIVEMRRISEGYVLKPAMQTQLRRALQTALEGGFFSSKLDR